MSTLELEKRYAEAVIERGKGYIDDVESCIKIKNLLYAKVQGSYLYSTKVDLSTLEGDCSCPYNYNCKHAVATYFFYKNGSSVNADDFLEDLQNLTKDELIKIIEKIIPERPDLINKIRFRKKENYDEWVNDFINDFSINELENIEENLDCLNFEQILKILDYVEKNESSLNDLLIDYYDSSGFYGYEEEDILSDFEYSLKDEIIKRITTKEQLIKILKRNNMNREICYNAENFFKYKDIIKTYFSQEEYLIFLLKSKNPDLSEIKHYIKEGSECYIYSVPRDNTPLGEKLAEYLDDNKLRFLVAYHKEDTKNIIKYFDNFSKLKENYFVQARKIVDILSKDKIIPIKIAYSLFNKEEFRDYNEKHLHFLLINITDANYIHNNTLFEDKFSKIKEVIKRLNDLDFDIKLVFFKKDFLLHRHWTEVVEILEYIRKELETDFIEKFIRFHYKHFINSSTLKYNLKKEGIIIQYIKGELKIKIK